MNEEQVLMARLQDLARRAYQQNIYTYSDFLTPAGLAVFSGMRSELAFIDTEIFGGRPDCERCMVRFGSERMFGYAGTWPICVIRMEPLLEKFSDDLSHRDFLGALMNLGIRREVLGDILVKDGKRAYLFCHENIVEYITEHLTKIKHTNVKAVCLPPDTEISDLKPELVDLQVIVAAPRFDAIVAATIKCSRGEVLQLFRAKKVTRNGCTEERNSLTLKDGDVFSVRGFGKFQFCGAGAMTRKGRINVHLKKYI